MRKYSDKFESTKEELSGFSNTTGPYDVNNDPAVIAAAANVVTASALKDSRVARLNNLQNVLRPPAVQAMNNLYAAFGSCEKNVFSGWTCQIGSDGVNYKHTISTSPSNTYGIPAEAKRVIVAGYDLQISDLNGTGPTSIAWATQQITDANIALTKAKTDANAANKASIASNLDPVVSRKLDIDDKKALSDTTTASGNLQIAQDKALAYAKNHKIIIISGIAIVAVIGIIVAIKIIRK
jgi:hypothetical protein